MDRPSFEEIYLNLATDLSARSTCQRLNVGCVITSTDYSQVYGVGYNGNAKGFPNCCDRDVPGDCGCLHAEENALLKVSEPASTPKVAFVTHLPCSYCAKRMVNKGGFQKVIYSKSYRSIQSIEILIEAGIDLIKITDFGTEDL